MELNERFATLFDDKKGEKSKYFDQVASILINSYEKIGGISGLDNGINDLMKDKYVWKLVLREGKVSAVVIYNNMFKDRRDLGRKLALCGSDGTPRGKQDLYKIFKEDVQQTERGVWGEVSGALEYVIQAEKYDICAKILSADDAIEVLKNLGKVAKPIATDDDNLAKTHYSRRIGDNDHVKVMYGNPPTKDKMDDIRKLRRDRFGESVLNEERMIKPGGEQNPKDGWCILMSGAGGSGKSTARKYLLPFEAKTFDVDEFKELAVRHGKVENGYFRFKDKLIPLDDIDPPYDTSNPDFVKKLHPMLKPLTDKTKEMIGINAKNGNRLENVIFDITGKDENDILSIVDLMKPIGYKICLVWCFNTYEASVKNRVNGTGRRCDPNLVRDVYYKVMHTLPGFLDRELGRTIDDAWIVLPVDVDLKQEERPNYYNDKLSVKKPTTSSVRDYTLADNVFRITKEDGSIQYGVKNIANKLYNDVDEKLRANSANIKDRISKETDNIDKDMNAWKALKDID